MLRRVGAPRRREAGRGLDAEGDASFRLALNVSTTKSGALKLTRLSEIVSPFYKGAPATAAARATRRGFCAQPASPARRPPTVPTRAQAPPPCVGNHRRAVNRKP